MNERPTPETDAFYATFADGLASPSQDEWLERLKRYERQRDGLMEALQPFAHYITVMEAMGGTTPKSGPVWGCHSRTGDAEISVEDMQQARAAIAAVKEGKQP